MTNQTASLASGQKVRFNGKTNIINDREYTGQVGTVDFQCSSVPGYEWQVYVLIRKPGQRKDRSISVHREALDLVEVL
jgi:hypothetical protein